MLLVVVANPDAEKCRGFGYVTYSMAEDSLRAMKEIHDYDGQRISVSVAKKKQQDQRKAGERKENAPPTSEHLVQLRAANRASWTARIIELGPRDPPAKEKKSKESFQGSRKNKLKSRLIIRNLSFKVSLRTEMHQLDS